MRQLLPEPREVDETESGLAAVYQYPDGSERWVRANFVASLDGSVQANGTAAGLSSPIDHRIFVVLRALADVVLVGAGTVRAEGYGPVRLDGACAGVRATAGLPAAVPLAVVSADLDLDFGAPLYTEATVPTITITGEDAPEGRLAAARAAGTVLTVGTGRVDLGGALDRLAELGLGRVLCEGGPRLLAGIVAARRLDELCLSLSPQLRAGSGFRLLRGPELDPSLGLTLHTLLTHDDNLFARYVAA